MLANSPVFVWLFLTGFIWCGVSAWGLNELIKKTRRGKSWLKVARQVMTFMAILSAFWFVACGLIGWSTWEGSYAEAFHWLFSGDPKSIYCWVGSLIALASGIYYELRVKKKIADLNGLGFSILLYLGLMALLGLYMMFAPIVNSVLTFG